MQFSWSKVSNFLLGIMLVLHLLVFTKYSFDPNPNGFTLLGEILKHYLPMGLLVTLLPPVRRLLDKLAYRPLINVAGIAFALFCVIYQIRDVPGQAWSTVAFSSLLILSMYNYVYQRYQLSPTTSIVFCFMTVYTGWLLFEVIYQIGLWYSHPISFGYSYATFLQTLRTVVIWMILPMVYIVFTIMGRRIAAAFTLPLLIVIFICVSTAIIWIATDMLVPIMIDAAGNAYRIPIGYFTLEHLQFSISRLCQISMMGGSALLFIRND